MTLIALHIAGNRLEILADGLSCHDKLTISRSRRIGANVVQTDVPGRTTLQKIFPHPYLTFAVAHCGSNQRNGEPIRAIVERFWHRTVSERCPAESLVQLFEEEFGSGATAETFWLLGWQAPGTPVVHVVGTDYERLDAERYWAGSGRDSLSHYWSDLDSLREMAQRFLDECEAHAPYRLPFFANCCGGHWHRLQLTQGESPRWLSEPRRAGVEVSALLPGSLRQALCDNPAQDIGAQGERLKEVLRQTLNVKTVRGALERIADEELRERVARLIAIFDEVQLDSEAASMEDARRYATAVEDAILRLIEAEVLDQRHRQCAILSRNETAAVRTLFRCYAQGLRDLRTGKVPKPSDDVKSQTADKGLRGLAHCLRWVKRYCPSRLVVPTPAPVVLAGEAMKLLKWGAAYDPIWNEHSAYSRGLVGADVDELNKTITFLPQRDVDPRFFCTQVESKKADDERLASAPPDAQLVALSKTWFDSVTPFARGMRFDDATIRGSGAIEVASSWMDKTCLPELDAATSLMDCTVGELRRVLATLYVYSLFVTMLEDFADDRPALGVVLPPCVAARWRHHMIDWLAGLSGVPAASVEAILSVLTFDPAHPHVTLAQQPFVASGDGQLLFLPRMLLFLDLPRMYVGALNKDKQGEAVYSQRSGAIEDAGVKSIASAIRGLVPGTFQLVGKATFCLQNGHPITPDMVLVSECDRTVLVIDVKYATPPFGPADVHQDVREMEKWKARMAEYVTSFQDSPDVLAQHFQWACQGIATVFGLILLRWPLPIPADFLEPVCAVDWPSLREYLQQAQPTSIRDLMVWARNRADLTAPTALGWTSKDVPAGEWTYRYSVLAPLLGERLLDLTQRLAYRLWEERGRPLWDDLRDWYAAEKQIAARGWSALDAEG